MNRLFAHREPFSIGERLLFAVLPLGIVAFALSGVWLRRVDAPAPITLPAPPVLPVPNGFDVYVAAAIAIRPAKPAVDPIDDPRAGTPPKLPLATQNYSLARRTAWLSANRAGFSLFKQATKTPSMAVSGSWRNFSKLRQLARSKVIEANTLILQKRWNEATRASLDTIQMGGDISRGGAIMARSTGSGIISLGRDPLSTPDFVPEKLTASEARAAARRLETLIAALPGWAEAIQTSKWESLAEFQSITQRGNWRAYLNQGNQNMTWQEKFKSQFVSARDVAGRIAQTYDQSLEIIKQPYNAPMTSPEMDKISAIFVYTNDFRFQKGREIVPLNVLLLRFALRAYRLENGAFPTDLKQLAPRYLKRIPTDYFASDAPFRYRKNGQNYDLWSVGPDKIDNGGTPMKNRNGESGANAYGRFPSISQEASGDFVAGKNR